MFNNDYQCSCCQREKEVFNEIEVSHLEMDGMHEELMFITCDECGNEVCALCWEECGHCYSAICHDCQELELDVTGTLSCKNCFVEEAEDEDH